MKNLLFTSVLMAVWIVSCAPKEQPTTEVVTATVEKTAKMTHAQQVEQGAYLVEIMGCNDCHSPKTMTAQGPIPDPKRLLSGHNAEEQLAKVKDLEVLKAYVLFNMNSTAAVGPWGTSFAANLTPDETGLGNWTLDNFEKAMREGKFKGLDNGRGLLPPMPWPNYSKLSNDDLAAIWAYLQSIPPVRNLVPNAVPPMS